MKNKNVCYNKSHVAKSMNNSQLYYMFLVYMHDFRLLSRGADRQRVPTLPPTLDLPASMCEVAAVGTHRSALHCTAVSIQWLLRQAAGDIIVKLRQGSGKDCQGMLTKRPLEA